MARVDDLTIVISTEFKDNTASDLKKLEKELSSSTKNIQDFEKQLKKAGSTNAAPTLSLKDQATSKVNTALDKLHEASKVTSTPGISLKDQATNKVNQITGSLKNYSGRSYSAIVNATDKASSVISKITSTAKSLTSKAWNATVAITDKATQPLRSVFNWLTSIKGIATTLFAGIAFDKLVVDPVGISDFYSTAQIGFETMLGSAEKAEKMMNDINQFAIATPFEAQGLVDVSQKMIAMGWSAERVLPDLEKIGNAMSALGKGQEGIERTTLALSQMQAKGKVSAEEMRQLTEVGISAWKYVADGIGVSTAEAQDMVSKGLIPVDQAINSIMQGMTQFDGMMDKTANATVSGLLSQLQEAATVNLWKPWGEGLAKGIRPGLSEINELMNTTLTGSMKLGDVLNRLGEQIGSTVMNTVSGVAKNFADIISNPTFQTASLAQKIKMLMSEGVAQPIKKWWNSGGKETVKDLATSAMKAIGSALKEGFPVIIEAAFSNPITATLASSWGLKIANNFLGGLMSGMQGTKSAITNTISMVKGISNIKNIGLGGFKDAVKDAGSLTGALKQLGSASKSVSGGLGGTTKSISQMITSFKLAYQSTGSFSQALTLARSSVANMGTSAAGAATSTGTFVSSLASIAPLALGVTAAVGAGVAIYVNYKNAVEQANAKQKEYLEHTQEVITASDQLNEQIQKNIQTRSNSIASVGSEAVVAQELANKIFTLKDAQDQSAGSHAQVKALVDQLNEVMPSLALNYEESTNRLTDQNGVLLTNKQALLDRIDALKQEAEAEAARELMTEAYKDQIESLTQMNTLMPEIQDAYNQLNEAKARYNQLVQEHPDGDSQELITARQEVENLSGSYNSLRSEMSGLQETYKATGQEINNYSSIISGSNQNALDSTTLSVDGITQKLNELPPTSRAVGESVGTNYSDGVNSQQQNANQAGQNLANNTNSGLKSTDFSATGSQAGNSWVESFKHAFDGIGSFFSNIFSSFDSAFSARQNAAAQSQAKNNKVSKYAEGGIMDKPHIGLVAEDGPEAIIPLGNKRKQQGIKLWQEAGERLGVYAHAEGGISSGNTAGGFSSGGGATSAGASNKNSVIQTEAQATLGLEGIHNDYLTDYNAFLTNVNNLGNDKYKQLSNDVKSINQGSYNDQNSYLNSVVALNKIKYTDVENNTIAILTATYVNIQNINSQILADYQNYYNQLINLTMVNYTTYVNIITQKMNEGRQVINSVLKATLNDINAMQSSFSQAGADLISSMNVGMQSKRAEIEAGASSLVASLKAKFEEGLGIHSPSRWGEWVGQMIDAGVIKGMDKGKLAQFVGGIINDMRASFKNGRFNADELIDYLGANGSLSVVKYLELIGDQTVSEMFGDGGTPAIIQEALKYVGYAPGGGNSMFGLHYGNPGAWCASFVRYCAEQVGVPFPPTNYVPDVLDWSIANGKYTTVPQPGYAAIFGGGSHIELVAGVSNGVVDMVGGNTGIGEVKHRPRNDATSYVALDGGHSTMTLKDTIMRAYNQRYNPAALIASTGSSSYDPNGGAEQWRSTVMQALQMLGQPTSLTDAVLYAIQSESGGNPRAINDYDVNWINGDPSRGLLQTIGATFNAYRNPNLSPDIYDPLSNIYAGLNYMIQRYGSVANVVNPRLGGWYGYAKGTDYASPGLHWVGEEGPELVQFSGGEKVYPHETSVQIERKLNETGASVISVGPASSEPSEHGDNVSINFDSGSFQFNFNLSSDNAPDLMNEFSSLLANSIDDIAGEIASRLKKVDQGTPQNGSLA